MGINWATVRAGAWVPRDGTATVTFKVDRMGWVRIGVLTERYNKWSGGMYNSDEAWSYDVYGCVRHAGKNMNKQLQNMVTSGPRKYGDGSEVTVSLADGRVT